MEFDLPAIDTKTRSEKGVPMLVRRLDGSILTNSKSQNVEIVLLGPDSDTYRAMSRAQIRKRVNAVSAGKDPAPEEEERDIIAFLVAITKGWTGVLDKAGEPIPFSPEAAQKLYEGYPVIRDQVDQFTARRENFIGG
jgi:hypothetical protein